MKASGSARGWRRLASAVVAGVLAASVCTKARADERRPATCKGYIGAFEAGARSQDPLAVQTYINLADEMYRAINRAVIERGMQPLPLPDNDESEAQRAMVVVGECKRNMALGYAEAVSSAYVKMRRALGLPVQLPAR